MYEAFYLWQINLSVVYKLHNPTKQGKNKIRLCCHTLWEKIRGGDEKNVSIMWRLSDSDSILPMSYPNIIFLPYF